MSKVLIRFLITAIFLFSSSSGYSQNQISGKGKLLLEPFGYSEVKLLNSPLKRQFDEVEAYYLGISNDDLLKGFRERVGLPTHGAGDLGGWYSDDIFHVFGQFLSGMSRLYAVSGNNLMKIKVNTLIDEWAKTIDRTGYFYYTDKTNAKHYIYDKMVGGLVDAYVFTGNKKALEYLSVITDWAIKNLDREKIYALNSLRGNLEWYTLTENLYRAYQITGNQKYLDFGKFWEYPEYWEIFANGGSIFDKKSSRYHAYSHLNTLSGAAMSYLINGNEKHKLSIINAYDFFRQEQCFATGGFGPNELLLPKEELINVLRNSHATFETQCGSWAIFKLCKYLLEITGDARYGDWIEKMTINGIGVHMPMTEQGQVLYYSDYNPREGRKYYHHRGWSCCTGTRPQAVAEYANLIYFKGNDELYVNLYTPSQTEWNNFTITQNTSFPESNETELTIKVKNSKGRDAKIHFRKPSWAKENQVVYVNGEAVRTKLVDNWIQIDRKWKDEDKIRIVFPLNLYIDKFDESKDFPSAIMYGPVAMVVNVTDEYPEDIIHAASFSSEIVKIDHHPLHYKIKGHPDLTLRPYYDYDIGEPYILYIDTAVKNRILLRELAFEGEWSQRPQGFFYSNHKGASISTNFNGEGIKLILIGSPNSGKVQVAIDGKESEIVDVYSTTGNTSIVKEYNLSKGTHHVTLSVTGEKRNESRDTYINVSGLEIIK